jgi:hypothetical protein
MSVEAKRTARQMNQAEERAWELRRIRPGIDYRAGRQDWEAKDRYQLQFHCSTHTIRAMFPGNGAGKTSTAAMEADFWAQGNHPYQFTPRPPVQVIWVCLKFQQMELLRQQLEETVLTRGWEWTGSPKHCYRWPNGSQMYIISNDGSWESIQGIGPDLVIIDEECDSKLWRELTMRRRGRKQTRYVIAATATRGRRWMYQEIYEPWLKFHRDAGMDIDAASIKQGHPNIWCWPKGGIEDNPGAGKTDETWYKDALLLASPAERQVRLHGGFQDFNSSPVFDLDALEEMGNLTNVARHGWFTFADDAKGKPVLDDGRGIKFLDGMQGAGGRISIYEEPTDDYYVVGADFGYGLPNRDRDAAVVFRQSTGKQVAVAAGRWGDRNFASILFCLCWFYREALLVGERQVGLPTLRRLYDEWDYRRIYYEKDMSKRYVRFSDGLGHHAKSGDLVIPFLAWAIAPRDKLTGQRGSSLVTLTDQETLQECREYEWRPRTSGVDLATATNSQLKDSGPPGGHDDLVRAAGYAYLGLRELGKFPPTVKTFAAGTMGDIMGHRDLLASYKENK